MTGKNVIITGSTGMIGSNVLRRCLENEDAAVVTINNRKKSGIVHPKLKEYVHSDFTNFDAIQDVFPDRIFASIVWVFTLEQWIKRSFGELFSITMLHSPELFIHEVPAHCSVC